MIKKVNISVLFIMLITITFVFTGCSGNSEEELKEDFKGDAYMQISMDEAVEMMKTEKNYIILDVRTYDEYKEGHIPGAVCVPNETIGSDHISELPDKEQCIMVYCRSGNRSKQAAGKLAQQGYTNVYEFGGIIDWKGELVY